jgi:hypothetical protein
MGEAMNNMDEQQLQSLKKLLIWIIVLGIMIGTLYIIGLFEGSKVDNKVVDTNVNSELTSIEKLELLINNDFRFKYIISHNDEKIIFSGEKSNNIVIGYKETQDNIIKYKIEDDKISQIILDNEIEIANIYDDLDYSLMDLNNIKSMINQIPDENIIKTKEDLTTTYTYNLVSDDKELEISIIENTNLIEKIIISYNNNTYELLYICNNSE